MLLQLRKIIENSIIFGWEGLVGIWMEISEKLVDMQNGIPVSFQFNGYFRSPIELRPHAIKLTWKRSTLFAHESLTLYISWEYCCLPWFSVRLDIRRLFVQMIAVKKRNQIGIIKKASSCIVKLAVLKILTTYIKSLYGYANHFNYIAQIWTAF